MKQPEIARMRELRARGLTLRQIAAELSVNELTVRRWRKQFGIEDDTLTLKQRAVQSRINEPLRDTILRLRNSGCEWEQIAQALGVNMWTLLLWRKQLGLPVNQSSRSTRDGGRD